MKIIENVEAHEVIIDGLMIKGFIYSRKCITCNHFLIYYGKYDALFCAYCDEWVEATCDDVKCEYCKSRPDRPL